MSYFNYHARAQNLIKTGHCTKAEIVEKHGSISPALVLHFDNHIPMPIRLHRFEEYFYLLSDCGVDVINHLN